jgi:hypothetical protein
MTSNFTFQAQHYVSSPVHCNWSFIFCQWLLKSLEKNLHCILISAIKSSTKAFLFGCLSSVYEGKPCPPPSQRVRASTPPLPEEATILWVEHLDTTKELPYAPERSRLVFPVPMLEVRPQKWPNILIPKFNVHVGSMPQKWHSMPETDFHHKRTPIQVTKTADHQKDKKN